MVQSHESQAYLGYRKVRRLPMQTEGSLRTNQDGDRPWKSGEPRASCEGTLCPRTRPEYISERELLSKSRNT